MVFTRATEVITAQDYKMKAKLFRRLDQSETVGKDLSPETLSQIVYIDSQYEIKNYFAWPLILTLVRR